MRFMMPFSLVLLAATSAAESPAAAPPPIEVRVAVVAFEDFHQKLHHWEQLLADLSRGHDPPLRLRLAAGSYGDVLHWVRRGLVDLAVMTPGVFAETLDPDGEHGTTCGCRYLATVGLPPATSAWADPERRQPGYHDYCRSVCVVPKASALRTGDDLLRAAADDRVQVLFVHPMSVSGRIAPEMALRRMAVELAAGRIGYTYSHTESLRMLSGPADGRQRIAFVWDDALRAAPEFADQVRRLPLPELEALKMPQNVVVARADYEHAELFRSLLAGHVDREGNHDFVCLENWAAEYEPVGQWSEQLGLSALPDRARTVSLDEIGRLLMHYRRSQPRPPRLALVLSGGGAKCAYQIGAVKALEEKLAQLRQDDPEGGLDIALVVGTSGGAINAVPVALGISADPQGQDDFQQVWTELDQREIIRPSKLVRANIGLWFALLQLACLLWLARRLGLRPERRGWTVAAGLVILAAAEILLGYLHWSPWSRLGENHFWHHAWLWCSFGVRASAWTLLGLGLAGLLSQGWLVRRGSYLATPGWTRWALAVALVGLPLLQVVTILFYEKTLSGGSGIEHALAEKFPRLINRKLARDGLPPLALQAGRDDARRLAAVSRQMLKRGLLKRDLVLTGSCLGQSTTGLPSDLYFYAAADPQAETPPFGPRGVSLHARPSILLDVVMGSGSIFPLFPPRTLRDFPREGEHVELVDGGFAHNSPIEAAALWGATHIVLIEASPERRIKRYNFLQNVAAAYVHLYKQSQLIDARSRGQVAIFTLAPQQPHICVLDFADNLIAAAAAKGYRDARGLARDGNATVPGAARFCKEPGEPVFTDVAAAGP